MKNGPIDPRIDRMIASLYGELSEAEERAFRRLLEKDDELRAEYEELRATRAALSGWEVEERVPSFVLLEGERRRSGGLLARLRESLGGFGASPAWGLAAAAVVLLVLAVAGFRVETVGNGIAFRFGEPEPTPPAATLPAREPGPTGWELAMGPGGAPGEELVPVGGQDQYLTRGQLDAYNAELLGRLVMLLNEYGDRRDQEITQMMRTVYERVASRQQYDYEELNDKINTLGVELLIARTQREQKIDSALDERLGPPRELAPTMKTEE